jgi:hypothetical protein
MMGKVVGLVAGLAVLAGCGDNMSSFSFTDTKGNTVNAAQSKDGSETMVTITGEHGGAIQIGEDKPPENLPEYVPAYENARWTGSLLASPGEAGPGGGMMSFTTSDTPEKVLEFYERKAIVGGLSHTLKGKTGDGDALSATAPDGRNVQVTARSGEDGRTNVEVVWADASMLPPVKEKVP